MSDRYDRWIRIATITLGILLLAQLVRLGVRSNPLAGVKVPALPSLPSDKTEAKPMNAPVVAAVGVPGTHFVAASSATNTVSGTNALVSAGSTTNASAGTNGAKASTNQAVASTSSSAISTNVASLSTNRSIASTNMAGVSTNATGASTNAIVVSTNVASAKVSPGPRGSGPPPGMPMPMGMMPRPMGAVAGPKLTNFPPVIQARIDKIVQSEILAPVMRPLPMALIGVAGDQALIRTATGQTGFIKEGASLGDVKLLKVGTNRVLVEHEKQTKELMIFSGFGSESLMPKQPATPQ